MNKNHNRKKPILKRILLIATVIVVGLMVFSGCNSHSSGDDPVDDSIDDSIDDSVLLQPIARFDCVPYQRITTEFKVGVVAFNHDGIASVEFSSDDLGYSGGTKTITEMTRNDRTGVWEYWTTLYSADFTYEGQFTLTALVTGNDGGTRTLDIPLVYSTATQHIAYVSTSGNDDTAEIDDETHPFATIKGATDGLVSTYGSDIGGHIVELLPGTHYWGFPGGGPTQEWTTIRGQDKDSCIITVNSGDAGGPALLKLQDVTFYFDGNYGSGYQPFMSHPDYVWFDNVDANGPGQEYSRSNPIRAGKSSYFTDVNIRDCDYAVYWGKLARNVNITNISNDAFFNSPLIINCTLYNSDPLDTYIHADAYQSSPDFEPGEETNRIIFGYKATNLHYQGIWAGTPVENFAVVNCLFETRTPYRPGYAGDDPSLYGGHGSGINGANNVVVWFNTFIGGSTGLYLDSETLTNSSFIGNIFKELDEWNTTVLEPLPYGLPGNTENNDFISNHYTYSAITEDGMTPGTTSPNWGARSPDTVQAGSQSLGTGVINTDTSSESTLGRPVTDSILFNRIENPPIPNDIEGNDRSQTGATIGAYES